MMLLPGWWRKHFLHVEFALCSLITVAFMVWHGSGGAVCLESFLKSNRAPIYGTLATIFGTLLGFIITAASIVLGFSGSGRMQVVRQSRHYPMLWKVFFSATRALGLATLVALVALIFDRDSNPISWLMFALFFCSMLVFFRVARAIWVLENVIKVVSGEK